MTPTALLRVTAAASLIGAAGFVARWLLDRVIDRVEVRLDYMAGEEG